MARPSVGSSDVSCILWKSGIKSSLNVCEGPHTAKDGPTPAISPLHPGLMVAFPFFLRHFVPPNQDAGDGIPRISVAFDVYVDFDAESGESVKTIDGAMSVLTIRQSIMFHATVDDNIMDNAESFARAAISALRSRADSFTFLEWYAAPELINDAKIPVRVKAWLGSPSSSRVVTWRETQELPGCSGVVLRGVYGTSSLTNDCQLFLDDRRIVSPSSGSVPTLSNTVWRRPQDRSFVKNARESEEFLQVLLSQVYH